MIVPNVAGITDERPGSSIAVSSSVLFCEPGCYCCALRRRNPLAKVFFVTEGTLPRNIMGSYTTNEKIAAEGLTERQNPCIIYLVNY